MSRHWGLLVACATAVVLIVPSAWAESVVTLNCWAADYLWKETEGGMRREIQTDPVRGDLQTVGNIYMGSDMGWNSVAFPGSPTKLIVSHAGPWAAGAEVLLDGTADGVFIGTFDWPLTGEFNINAIDTFDFDPLLQTLDLSGNHSVWLIFHGGGSIGEGCGNYEYFAFVFPNGSDVKISGRDTRMGRSPGGNAGFTVRGSVGRNDFSLVRADKLYSVNGRRVIVSGNRHLSIGDLVGKSMLITQTAK